VACIHIAALRVPYEEELYFYKTLMIPYDYELIYALGSMIGVFDIKGMLELINQVEIFGIDAMSTGVTLAWTTEAMMKGIITTKDTLGLKLRWGDYETYIKVLQNIVNKPNEFYQQLANGVEAASKKYGGRDFALAFGGNEMPGYHTGPVTVTSYLVGSRHSHLDAAGYSIDQAILKGDKISIDEAVQKLYDEESWRQIISGLVICFFARGIYDIDTVVQALGVSGIKKDKAELNRLGHEILELKYRFKKQNGFKPEELRIPARVLETESARGPISEDDVRYAVSKYYELLENQAHG
jgi:aldehyde:ferredoxin oxidoreductase